MLMDVVEVRPVVDYRLWLRFEDGSAGEVDLAAFVIFDGIFTPLREPGYFRSVRVDADSGTIAWPNGADLDPDVLYARVTGRPIVLDQESAA